MNEALPEWPAFGLADDVRPALRAAAATGKPLVLATLTALGGGGPRPVGTQMVFGHGVVSGYFSGGCVESDVAAHAQACLADGAPRTLVYGEGSPWPDIQLLCGARVETILAGAAAAAKRLCERLGFESWGVEPDALRVDGRSIDVHHMGLRLARDA